ncbi:MAG TPA: dolichyl-phosphate beta-glucosyltransferase [Acidisarcina sp.]|nr:dolichyl-phosphate beta-glucosyltransferase [Acidisarcina sp.]
MSNPQYSIIIPAYNEAARIGKALTEVLECMHRRNWSAEVIVVNDGSKDATAEIVEEFVRKDPAVRLLQNPGNRGKGYSVRHGILEGLGDILMFTDADLSAPIQEAERLFAAIAEGADIAIGSRWLERTRQTIHQPLYRQIFGRCFNLVTRSVIRLPFADTQCGFKAFRRAAAHTVFGLQRIERWGFDPELLFIALRKGYKVREVPVTWGHDERSRISYLKDGLRMLEDILYVRWNSLIGVYDREPGTASKASSC